MIIINTEKCIGCGLCEKDCVTQIISMKDDKAVCSQENCIECYHCIAICPTNAVSASDADNTEIIEYEPTSFEINPETFLNRIKLRRSVRQYTDEKVKRKEIERIIEAGRFTPTGGNSQNISYLVIEKDVKQLTELALKSLYEKATKTLQDTEKPSERMMIFMKRWEQMYFNYMQTPNMYERLFFSAKTIILVISDSTSNANLAASNMEMMASMLGLGACHIGFFLYACDNNTEIKEFLGLKKEQNVAACLTIGYPAIKYLRTVPRKKSVVDWR